MQGYLAVETVTDAKCGRTVACAVIWPVDSDSKPVQPLATWLKRKCLGYALVAASEPLCKTELGEQAVLRATELARHRHKQDVDLVDDPSLAPVCVWLAKDWFNALCNLHDHH
jgi:hypothetical protein